PAPRSAPFPYTTLFRSDARGQNAAIEQGTGEFESLRGIPDHDRGYRRFRVPGAESGLAQPVLKAARVAPKTLDALGFVFQDVEGDRKSTRLNSSHVAIS